MGEMGDGRLIRLEAASEHTAKALSETAVSMAVLTERVAVLTDAVRDLDKTATKRHDATTASLDTLKGSVAQVAQSGDLYKEGVARDLDGIRERLAALERAVGKKADSAAFSLTWRIVGIIAGVVVGTLVGANALVALLHGTHLIP